MKLAVESAEIWLEFALQEAEKGGEHGKTGGHDRRGGKYYLQQS